MREIELTPGVSFDYEAFSKKLIGARELVETRYYTGRVRQEDNRTYYQNQCKFLTHLARFSQIKVSLGRLESRPPPSTGKKLQRWLDAFQRRDGVDLPPSILDELTRIVQSASAPILTEKAVDVMIATDMISLAYEDRYDVAYLISADGDFTPAVKKARNTGRQVFAASPLYGQKLAEAVDTFIPMNRAFFHGCWL